MTNEEMPRAIVRLGTCQCCGVTFGIPPEEKRKGWDVYCAAHRWLLQSRLLGIPHLEGIEYDDVSGRHVMGNRVRWSYFIPETDQNDVLKVRDGIRDWLRDEYLEKMGLERIPKVVVTETGLVVTDLHKISNDKNRSLDTEMLARHLRKIDEIYITVL